MDTIVEFKCPSCGGALEFDFQSQKLKCPYCDSEFEIQVLEEIEETSNKVEMNDNMDNWNTSLENKWVSNEEKVFTYICQSCGGEIIVDENTGATTCPFCGNHVVMNNLFIETYKPDLIIPFKLDKNAAKEKFYNYLSNKKLLPQLFKNESHIDEIIGIYVPFWLYNADVDGAVKYNATRVRHWSTSKYNYTETSYYELYREGNVVFRDIPVDGSSKMPDDLMDSLEPFDLKEAVDFNPAYFAGYMADKYDVTIQDNIPRINTRVKRSVEAIFSSSISNYYDSLSISNSYIDLKNGNAKYALLPVWLLNTTWKNQKFIFAMNGQTGKIVGNLPMDKGLYWKYWLKAFACSVPFGLIISFIIKLLTD